MAPVLFIDEYGIHYMKKNKYVCPYCGAPIKFERPFTREVEFLFWISKISALVWYADCGSRYREYFHSAGCVHGRTLAECRRNWRKWYDAETAGLPDYPILAYAKYGKDIK